MTHSGNYEGTGFIVARQGCEKKYFLIQAGGKKKRCKKKEASLAALPALRPGKAEP